MPRENFHTKGKGLERIKYTLNYEVFNRARNNKCKYNNKKLRRRNIQYFNINRLQERNTTDENVDLTRMKGATPLQNTDI